MIRLTVFFVFTALLATDSLLLVAPIKAAPQHGFSIPQYKQFHDVLHPLEHEALPQKDFRRIRSQASELVRRGKAIVKVGVPEGFPTARQELSKELKKFDKALARFQADAKSGTDDQLKASYSAVHDSFEILASILPTLYPRGMPPVVRLDCPSGKPEAGSQITITAQPSYSEKLSFTWTVSAGKIQTGDGTPTITLDTTGLAGQTIKVSVEVDAGSGLMAFADCEVQIAPQAAKVDPLQPLLFLEGNWHGEGKGPYGPYEFETIVERRGRWLLLTSDVFPPGSDKILFVSTQVYGYDDKGLVLHLFDTAGSFEFRGEAKDKAVHFEWKQGDKWKRAEFKLVGNNIHSRYDALEPSMFKDPVSFEGVWLPGKRPSRKP